MDIKYNFDSVLVFFFLYCVPPIPVCFPLPKRDLDTCVPFSSQHSCLSWTVKLEYKIPPAADALKVWYPVPGAVLVDDSNFRK